MFVPIQSLIVVFFSPNTDRKCVGIYTVNCTRVFLSR